MPHIRNSSIEPEFTGSGVAFVTCVILVLAAILGAAFSNDMYQLVRMCACWAN